MPNPHPHKLTSRALAYATHPRWIARRLAWEVLRRTRRTVTIDTEQGQFRIRTANRVIGTQLYTRRSYEEGIIRHAMLALSEERLSPKDGTVIDVGANIGMSSIALVNGRYCARCIAIEPEPRNFSDLIDNVRRNQLSERISCHQFAASDREGQLTMELADVNFGDHRVRTQDASQGVYGEADRATATVPARTLDSFAADIRIAALWVDVQGYDAYVLGGAQGLIRSGVPVVTEFWPYGQRRAGVARETYLSLLDSLFSRCYIITEAGHEGPSPIRAVESLYDEIGEGIADATLVLLA